MALKGRCYCGAVQLRAPQEPLIVAYCHCRSCRRQTGAPVAAFAAFKSSDVEVVPGDLPFAAVSNGVARHFCGDCGSPIMARYDYLPDQVYVPVGLFDDAAALVPAVHAHEGERLPWLCLTDNAPRIEASSRNVLNAAEGSA